MNTFLEIWRGLNPVQKKDLAEDLETSVAYLSQLAHGFRNPSKHLAVSMGRIYDVDRSVLFPRLFKAA